MKKSLSVLLSVALSMSAFNVLAHDDSQDLCYPLAHGENGLGSTNSVYSTFLHTAGVGWNSQLYVTNTSSKKLNVKVILRAYDGTFYTPSQYSFKGAFNSSNSPLEHLNGGAILKPLETGAVLILDDSPSESFTGEISWQADACLESAMTGTQRVYYLDSNRIDQGLVLFNGGKPF